MNYQWDFTGLVPYLPAFARGLLVTLELAFLSSIIGTLLGVPLAVGLRASWLISAPVWGVVDVIRAIPNLVLIFFFYYFPYQQLFGLPAVSGFTCVLLALSIAQAAYSADLIRSAIQQVPRSQILGVLGIGLKPKQVLTHVTIPSVVKQTLPGHIALWIGNIKLTSLASVIGVTDVVYVAKLSMAQNFRSLEAWLFVALIYAAIVLPCTVALRQLERSNWILRQ